MTIVFKIVLVVFVSFISKYNLLAANYKEICIDASLHISRAQEPYSPKIANPRTFHYQKLDKKHFIVYSDYYLGNNPSPDNAYVNLVKGLVASYATFSGKGHFVGNYVKSYDDLIAITSKLKKILLSQDKAPFIFNYGMRQKDKSNFLLSFSKNVACFSLDPLYSNECVRALNYIVNSSDSKLTDLGNTLYASLISKHLQIQPRVLIEIATFLLDKIYLYLTKNISPPKDFYEEISSFLEEKKYPKDEIRKTILEILAVFSSRGAAWFKHNLPNNDSSSLKSILIITTAIQFFDKITYAIWGKQFSIPTQIKTSCYYPKPYHFWMAAYMAYDASYNERISQRGALVATHLLGAAYEMARIGILGYRSTFQIPFTKDQFKSPGANMIRIDLTFNTLGAWFGAIGSQELYKMIILDADKALDQVFSNSSEIILDDLDKDSHDAKKLFNFRQYYAPNAHLKYILSRTPR